MIVRVFDAPRELVFKAWTEPERFATWFGEHGSSIPLDTGGDGPPARWCVARRHAPRPRADRDPVPGEFREVAEPERVVMTLPTRTAVTPMRCSPSSSRIWAWRTEMTFTQRGGNLPADEYSRAMRGSLIFFDRLADHLGEP